MDDKPILFSSPMVRAILEGRKTMTRRVVKPQPTNMDDHRRYLSVLSDVEHKYGKPGDRLWVRETWQDLKTIGESDERKIVFKADWPNDHTMQNRWRPSIHMPRWASRILLEVIAVRVERVQDISYTDCLAEGVESRGDNTIGQAMTYAAFADLWNGINFRRGYGWNVNPWVGVVSFRQVRN